MGNMIGILSTVILVSTLATLIFAVGAYVLARRRRRHRADATPNPNADTVPEEPVPPLTGPLPPAPPTPPPEAGPGKPVFRRLTPRGEEPASPETSAKNSGWEWE